jgi:hypothetical protein
LQRLFDPLLVTLRFLLLLLNHVALRSMLRWYWIRGGSSRIIVNWVLPEAAADFASQLQQNP